jgi:hypothetical protein
MSAIRVPCAAVDREYVASNTGTVECSEWKEATSEADGMRAAQEKTVTEKARKADRAQEEWEATP